MTICSHYVFLPFHCKKTYRVMTLAASALQNISLLLFSKHDCLKMDQYGMDLVTTFFGPFWGVAAAAFWKGNFGTAKISWVTLRLVKYSKKVI